jgi:hypothetical protein
LPALKKPSLGSNLRLLEASVKAVKAPGRISPRIYAAIHMDFQPPEIFSVVSLVVY